MAHLSPGQKQDKEHEDSEKSSHPTHSYKVQYENKELADDKNEQKSLVKCGLLGWRLRGRSETHEGTCLNVSMVSKYYKFEGMNIKLFLSNSFYS